MGCSSSDLADAYSAISSLGGVNPDLPLVQYASLLPEGPVLDAGIGDGRNSLFLASMGREIDGLDASDEAVATCLKKAEERGLSVTASVRDLRHLEVAQSRYALAIAAWVLHFLKPIDCVQVARKLRTGLVACGLVYVAVFSTDDPGYQHAKTRFERVGDRTFYLKKIDRHLHFFTTDELLGLFDDLETVYLAQGRKLDVVHGDPHFHGFIEYLGRRQA